MKQITTSKGIFIFLEVPDNAKTLGDICDSFDVQVAQLGIDLNKTKLICTTKNSTEEQAAMFGICAITKDGTMYKYGVVADDGLPAAMDEDGWVWSEFELTLQGAINKFLKQNKLARKNNYLIIQKL